MTLDSVGLEAAAKVLAFRDLAADPDWHGVYEEEWAAQPEEYREAWRESVREVLAPYLAAVVPVTCPECGTEVPPRYSPEASGWYCGGCARPVARDPVPVTPTTENPTARQVLAEAFDGVIHHACGPDDWAAGHALDALAAAGFSVAAGRAAGYEQGREDAIEGLDVPGLIADAKAAGRAAGFAAADSWWRSRLVSDETVEAVARVIAGPAKCCCDDDWRQPRSRVCPAHGEGSWPYQHHYAKARAALAALLPVAEKPPEPRAFEPGFAQVVRDAADAAVAEKPETDT